MSADPKAEQPKASPAPDAAPAPAVSSAASSGDGKDTKSSAAAAPQSKGADDDSGKKEKSDDPKVSLKAAEDKDAATIAAVAKKVGEAKTSAELNKFMEDELKALKAKPSAVDAEVIASLAKRVIAAKNTEDLAKLLEDELKELKKRYPSAAKAAAPAAAAGDAPAARAGGAGGARLVMPPAPPRVQLEPWICGACTFNNGPSPMCEMCMSPNPAAPQMPMMFAPRMMGAAGGGMPVRLGRRASRGPDPPADDG